MRSAERKVLITISENHVASRFDLATEVLVATLSGDVAGKNQKTMVLPHPSAEDLCQLILSEGVGVLVCGGIEEEYYQYLVWKKVDVLDSIMGPWTRALEKLEQGALERGTNLFGNQEKTSHVQKSRK